MKILFEDNPEMPVSKFMKQVIATNDMLFTSGNQALREVTRVLSTNGEPVVCYVDMCWDNGEAEDVYTDLLELASRYSELTVVRIPCIEFYLILGIQQNHLYDFKDSILVFKYLVYGGDVVSLKYSAKSFERYCKGLLGGVKKRCLVNSLGSVDSYYLKDCPCGYAHCNQQAEMFYKAVAFVLTLPKCESILSLSEVGSEVACLMSYTEDKDLYSRMWHSLYDGGE